MRGPVNFLSFWAARRNNASASTNRPCFARIVPIRFRATGRSGVTFRTAASSFSASGNRFSRIKVATCSKSWTTSGVCANRVVPQKHKAHSRHAIARAFLRLPDKLFLINFPLAFLDGHNPVHSRARDLVYNAARPAHLNAIDFRPLLETEMQSEITL